MNINIPVMKVGEWAARAGITRLIPGISESDAIKYGTLTEQEKEIYWAVFFNRTATTIPKEYIAGKDDAEYIELDCPHYIHDYEYERISEEIKSFLSK